ncbi:YkgJ family cysteine cluster protein [Methanocalculus chunghsingensis]|nr:YkgJ family cysteine cluster protein [Methanocalculus chunghsingensis]
MSATPRLTRMIERLNQEREALLAYPWDELVTIIQEVGFSCTCCGRCCTREFNGHLLLLEEDTERVLEMAPGALIPAPYFEYCDNTGILYTSGYTLRMKEDGSCHFLGPDRRCTIYAERMGICRLYPYMLHREPGEDGSIDWRQIAGLNQHGEYHDEIERVEAEKIAAAVLTYEEAYLAEEIAFLEALKAHFQKEKLRHIPKILDQQMAAFRRGEPVPVKIYYKGAFVDGIADCRESGMEPHRPGKR